MHMQRLPANHAACQRRGRRGAPFGPAIGTMEPAFPNEFPHGCNRHAARQWEAESRTARPGGGGPIAFAGPGDYGSSLPAPRPADTGEC